MPMTHRRHGHGSNIWEPESIKTKSAKWHATELHLAGGRLLADKGDSRSEILGDPDRPLECVEDSPKPGPRLWPSVAERARIHPGACIGAPASTRHARARARRKRGARARGPCPPVGLQWHGVPEGHRELLQRGRELSAGLALALGVRLPRAKREPPAVAGSRVLGSCSPRPGDVGDACFARGVRGDKTRTRAGPRTGSLEDPPERANFHCFHYLALGRNSVGAATLAPRSATLTHDPRNQL